MIQIKHILVPTDFSECAHRAYQMALHISEQFKSKLTVLHARVLFSDDPNAMRANFEKIKQTEQEIDRFLLNRLKHKANYASKHILVEHEVTRGYSAAPAILDYIDRSKTDLVVMGTHGHTGLGYFLLGSVAEQVVRYASCPVLTLRPKVGLVDKPKKILVPYDFTDLSKKSFHYAVNFARKFKSKIDMIYVFDQDIHPALYAWGMKSIKDMIPNIEERVESSFKQTIKSERASKMNIEYHVKAGKAHREINKFADDQGHDLIIIATHAHSGVDRFLLGSVTEKVVRSAPSAVLTLKLNEKDIVN